jgi:biopolymer transport protein ExbB
MRGAWQLVADNDAIECQVVAAGLRAIQRGPQACAEAMLSAKSRLKGKLDARLAVLGTIGSNAPFIGLLGTVLGIIKAATDLTAKDNPDPTAVMAGVFEALVATAVGLFVAIPAVIFYNYFQRKVKGTLARVDSLAHLVLTTVSAERRASPPPAAAPQPQPARVP